MSVLNYDESRKRASGPTTHVPPVLGDDERAQRLIANPVTIDLRDASGRTALHRAAQQGKSVVCRILLDGGADASVRDVGGLDAAALARQSGHAQLARVISDHQAKTKPIPAKSAPFVSLTAADVVRLFNAPVPTVMALIAAGKRDARDSKGDTLLHLAARRGALLACEKLFEAGIDIETLNNEGKTAADSAEAAGQITLAGMLRGKSPQVRRLPLAKIDPTPLTVIEDAPDFSFGFGEFAPDHVEPIRAGGGFGEAAGEFIAIKGHVIIQGDDDEVAPVIDFGDPGPVEVLGEGIAEVRGVAPAHEGQSFLKVRARGRKSRKSARLSELTPVQLAEDDCRDWLFEVQQRGRIDPILINDLIDLCVGGHVDDLAANATRFLEDCGFTDDEGHFDPLADLDLDEMADGLMALCNRAPVLVGGQAFTLTAAEERRMLLEIRRCSALAEAAVAADDVARSAVISLGRGLLAGVIEPVEVTRIEFGPGDPKAVETFRVRLDDLEILHDDLYGGVETDPWMLNRMTEAVQALGLLPEIIEGLAEAVAAADRGKSLSLTDAVLSHRSAIHAFLGRHLPWVRLCASRECQDDEEVEDVFQNAWLGMRRALSRFDADRGNRFITYSSFWMRQTLLRARWDTKSLVRIPVHRIEDVSRLDAAVDRLERSGRTVTDAALCDEAHIGIERVTMLGRFPRHPVELDDTATDPDLQDPAFDTVLMAERTSIVARALADFDDRQAAIIRGRFGFNGEEEQTLEGMGQLYGVTRERIRQVEAKVLDTLAHHTRLGRIERYL